MSYRRPLPSPTRGAGAPPSLRLTWRCRISRPSSPQRGAPAPLPHCGPSTTGRTTPNGGTNEGRRRPSLIAANKHARRPPFCSPPTRGAGAPPSLRHIPPQSASPRHPANEGRRRPSLIAARACWGYYSPAASPNEGRRRPSLIAARLREWMMMVPSRQRGAPAPLPHCGMYPRLVEIRRVLPTRGAGAPPSLRRRVHGAGRQDGPQPTRGAGAPPSLRRRDIIHSHRRSGHQRGAPAPLPHCGPAPSLFPSVDPFPTRGAGAPPSLRPCSVGGYGGGGSANEGRRRPSLIAGNFQVGGTGGGGSNEGRRRPSLIAARSCRI